MVKYLIVLTISILFISFCSCDNNDKNKMYDNYPSGEIKSFYNSKGDSSGTSIHFYKNGKISEICFYKNGKEDGLLCKFDSLGNKTMDVYYKNGVENGSAYYFKDGYLDSFDKVTNGKVNGKSIFYKKDGTIDGIDYIKNGILYLSQKYDSLGCLFLEIEINNKVETNYVYINGKRKLTSELSDEENDILKNKFDYFSRSIEE